jgi:hypothetical protein
MLSEDKYVGVEEGKEDDNDIIGFIWNDLMELYGRLVY